MMGEEKSSKHFKILFCYALQQIVQSLLQIQHCPEVMSVGNAWDQILALALVAV